MTDIGEIPQLGVREDTEAQTGAGTSAAHHLVPRLATAIGAAAAIAVGSMAGMWYLPFVAGLAAGVVTRLLGIRARSATGYAAAAALGWPAVLLARSLAGQPIGATARAVAALAGLPALAVVTVAATVLIALLQVLVGLWLGRSVTAAMR